SVLSVRYSLTNFPDKRIGYYGSLTTPMRIDSVTGVTTGNALAYKSFPRRDEVDAKLSKYLAGARVNQNVSFGVQFMRNRYIEYDIQPGGVLYTDVNGAPDQATFTPPSTLAASYNGQALWAEDEITLGRRLTMKFGGRFDRMVGISQDVAQVDTTFAKTGQTIQGLGKMFTWTKLSPRAGVNLKLTKDDKTVLRATVGRYYRPIVLADFQ